MVLVELGAFDVALEEQCSRVVVLAEHRDAGNEDEVEPALGIDHDQAAVEGEVEIAFLFVSRRAQFAKRARRYAIGAELGDE